MRPSSDIRGGSSGIYHEDVVRRTDECIAKRKASSATPAGSSLEENGVVLRCWNDEAELELAEKDAGEGLERKLQKGEFGIGFYPSGVRYILSEEELEVQDRSFQIGDVCKRSHQSVFSGVILEATMKLRLAHAISGQVLEREVPASAVQNSLRIMAGDHVIYNNWVGVVEEIFEEALVSVGQDADLARICDVGAGLSVGQVPPPEIQQLTGHTSFWQSILSAAPGNTAIASSQNCAVVDVRQTVCCVNWLGINQKLSVEAQNNCPRPQRYFSHEIELLTLVRSFADEAHALGDKVIFRTPELAHEYGLETTYHGRSRHPVSVMNVLDSRTEVKVLWQDASQTIETAKSLIPYLNVDEYDVWPGDFVVWKGDGEAGSEGRVAVVQSMDPHERTAEVLWYGTTEKEVVPVLELDVHGSDPATFGIHRGDVVFISSAPVGHTLPSLGRIGESEDLPGDEELRSLMGTIGMAFSRNFPAEVPLVLPRVASPTDEGVPIDWYGAVMDLRPEDGTVEIRLPNGRRVHESIEKLTLFVDGWDDTYAGWDDDAGSDMTDDDGSSDLSNAEWVGEDGDAVLEKDDWEDVPEDDEMEDAWGGPTEEEQASPAAVSTAPQDPNPGESKSKGFSATSDTAAHTGQNGNSLRTPNAEDLALKLANDQAVAEASASKLTSSMPLNDERWSRFEILEEAPADHSFLDLPLGAAPPKAYFSRLQKEFRVLRESLPDSILVRSYEDRSDLLRVLIIGSEGTPYEDAPFVIDFALKSSYPHEPPLAHFHSWTNNTGRISPNLYEEGKVCLSILNTWTGERSESWNAHKSSLLQIFVSVQALVLVREPWFTEPAYERLKGTEEGKLNSALYSEKAYILARGFVRRALERPPLGLESELDFFYYGWKGEQSKGAGTRKQHTGRLERVLQRAEKLISDSEEAKRSSTKEDSDIDLDGGADSSSSGTELFVDAVDVPDSTVAAMPSRAQEESAAVSRLSGGGTIVLKRTLAALHKLRDARDAQESGR